MFIFQLNKIFQTFSNKTIFLFSSLSIVLVQADNLVELQPNDNCDLAIGEIAIRETFNNLFITLRIRDVRKRKRLKEFSTIHNFFVSTTLSDCDNLKEIEMLSQVNNIDKEKHFISQINEVINANDMLTDTNILTIFEYVEIIISKLRYLKNNNKQHTNGSQSEVNKQISKRPNNNEVFKNISITEETRTTNSADDNVTDNTEVWSRRINNGYLTDIEVYPFMASIHALNSYRCGGCIINHDVILTSATCLQLLYKSSVSQTITKFLSVRIGSSKTESGGQKLGVRRIHFHPQYNSSTLENNLGLVWLNKQIRFTWNVKRIDLDKHPKELGSSIIVLGWTDKDKSTFGKKLLSYTLLDRYPDSVCEKVYGKMYVSSIYFCAGIEPHKGSTCKFDVGAPGIYNSKLSGIYNFGGEQCGDHNSPTVFTTIGNYSDWIKSTSEQLPPIESTVTIPASTDLNKLKRPMLYFGRTYETVSEIVTSTPLFSGVSVKKRNFDQLFKDFKDFVSVMFGGRASD